VLIEAGEYHPRFLSPDGAAQVEVVREIHDH
jgi:hypothetical protein